MTPLPIDPLLPAAVAALAAPGALVVTAAPGAGKSTRLPPALARVAAGQVLLLQPRRVAARALARRIAEEQGWTLGQEVGYQVRHERVGGPRTRLWVLTEGVLTRRIQDDPLLDGVACVILDEFHERHLHSDLALAWCAELRRSVRPELGVVVMSATIDPAPVARFLGGAPVLDAPGRPFPVAIRHAPGRDPRRLDERVAEAVRTALAEPDSGDVLVFLPGAGEIRGCQALLDGCGAPVLPLHGQLPPEAQDRCLAPSRERRVILATNVAETSLTIPGVRTVVDSGEHRVARFDPDAGLDTLLIEGIPRFSADQRAGRAGRTAPGRCWRLWSGAEDRDRPNALDAEVRRCDLAGTLLTLAACGERDPGAFAWYEPPDPERLDHARRLLRLLGLVAADGTLTADGTRAATMPLHPRWARLLLAAQAAGRPRLGASLAAVSSGRDLRVWQRGSVATPSDSDALDDLERLDRAEHLDFHRRLRDEGIDPGAAREAAQTRRDLVRQVRCDGTEPPADAPTCAKLLLTAWPDRIARRAARDGNRVALVGGLAAEIDPASGLHALKGRPRPELLLAYRIQGVEKRSQIATQTMVRAGCDLDESWLADRLERRTGTAWNAQRGTVDALIGWWIGDLCIRTAVGEGDAAAISACLHAALLGEWDRLLAEQPEAASFLARLRWLRRQRPDLDLPDPDTRRSDLLADLCHGCRSRAEVLAKPWLPWMQGWLPDPGLLDRLAPERIEVPTGNRIVLTYDDPERPPVLAVRLQELFGLPATPRINDGRSPVLLHLLAPNHRVEQVTGDLASFWANTYPQVRKDLRGRYPRHSWPENPLEAEPTARAKRRGT
ncbi:MAG: ATP-dependent helicase HrpB [Planctomycetota bacterium]|jgi:ATP-dependent helicase HrpB